MVATQVLEAGVDISANRLISDLAPWGSMVQRFGRVNRYGELSEAEIWWVDAPTAKKQKDPAVPYTAEEVDIARQRLTGLASASPEDLEGIAEDGLAPWQHVLRKADLVDLFDTTPDISGAHIDVSRFIRATEDKDVYLAWRSWPEENGPPTDLREIEDDELCPVPIGEFREFALKQAVYSWNFATEVWDRIDRDRPLYPGMVAVTRQQSGGYTSEQGWSPESKAPVDRVSDGGNLPVEGHSDDKPSFPVYQQSLRGHTTRVMEETERLIASLCPGPVEAEALRDAALKHDWGKAHEVFQRTMHRGNDGTELLAKREGWGRHDRKHFGHELASALAMLASGDSDLAAYLAAAHHGRVRLGIHSMPGEAEVRRDQRTARGIRDGDALPACELAAGISVPEVTLSLEPMEFGAEGGSWTERVLRLRDRYGPFRLAYLELLLRSADEKASAEPRLEAAACNR